MSTRTNLKTAAENGALLTDELKDKLPRTIENLEEVIIVTCGAIITFCIVGMIAAVVIATKPK